MSFTLSQFRKENPQHNHLDSIDLANRLYKSNPEISQAGLSFDQFAKQVGVEDDMVERDPVYAGDFTRAAAISLDRMGQLVGRGVDAVGLDTVGQGIENYYKSREEENRAGQSASYRREMGKKFIERNAEGERTFGPAWTSPTKVTGTIMESSAQTAAGMFTGGALTHGLIKAGVSGGLAGIVGGMFGEGVMGGAEASKTAYDTVMHAPIAHLQTTPEFQAAYHELGDEHAARERIASGAAKKAFVVVGSLTAATGAPSGHALGKVIAEGGKNRIATGVRQAIHEGAQEAVQSGVETHQQNLLEQHYVDPSIDPMRGVDESMVEGAISGMAMGGPMGVVMHKPAISTDLLDEGNDQPPVTVQQPDQQPPDLPVPQPTQGAALSPEMPQAGISPVEPALSSEQPETTLFNPMAEMDRMERFDNSMNPQASQPADPSVPPDMQWHEQNIYNQRMNPPVSQTEIPSVQPDMSFQKPVPESQTGPKISPTDIKSPVDKAAHEAATSPLNDLSEPTDPQIKAGNYKKGHPEIDGVPMSVENSEGSIRQDKENDPPKWKQKLTLHYGYVLGTKGNDKDHLDAFIKPGTETSPKVFIIDQQNPGTGKFDEHKLMFGMDSKEEAAAAYHDNYKEGWQGMQNITEVPMDEFKKWAFDGKRKTKAFASKVNDFKKWFGDSRIVDGEGKPLSVYHGTSGDFDTFDFDLSGDNTGWASAKLGASFTPDRGYAEGYAKAYERNRHDPKLKEAHLSIQNPFEIELYDEYLPIAKNEKAIDELKKRAISEGRDGVVVYFNDKRNNGKKTIYEAFAFSPDQIRTVSTEQLSKSEGTTKDKTETKDTGVTGPKAKPKKAASKSDDSFNPLDILMAGPKKAPAKETPEIIKEIDNSIQVFKSEIEDWAGRKYKKNAKTVAAGGTKDDLNAGSTTISNANENRRTRNIKLREEAIVELEKTKDRLNAGEDEKTILEDLLDARYIPLVEFAENRLGKSKAAPKKAIPKKAKAPKGSKVRTLRGAIKQMGGIDFLHYKGELKSMPTAVKFLSKKGGMPVDVAVQSLKSDGFLHESDTVESYLEELRTNPDILKRDRITKDMESKADHELSDQEKRVKKEMEEFDNEAPPDGEYVEVKAKDLPMGEDLTIIENKSTSGWDKYEVIEKDGETVTLQDGVTQEFKPDEKVQVLKEDLKKNEPTPVPTEGKKLFEEKPPSLFDAPQKEEAPKKPRRKKKEKGESIYKQEFLWGTKQKDLFDKSGKSKTKPKPAAVEKKLSDVQVKVEAIRESTGEKVEVTEDAQSALDSVNEQISTYEKLLNCLAA